MSADERKLIERIQKLHAMALSAKEVGSLAEADSFKGGGSLTGFLAGREAAKTANLRPNSLTESETPDRKALA